jgi:hypothetical protein
MKAKNYICTAKGFVVEMRHDENGSELITTTRIREASAFSTKSAKAFLERNEIEGFVWKPFEQEAIRNMYTVKKITKYDFQYEDEKCDAVDEWQPVKLKMTSDTDIGFLMSGKLEAEEAMTFEEAKDEALKRNTEMLAELMEKMDKLKTKTEDDNL